MSKVQNKNVMIKFLALFISILLWSYVTGDENPKATREFKGVNVEFINESILNDAGLIVLDPKAMKISVKISGRRSDVNSVKPEDIKAQVDLSGVSKGSQRILINVEYPFKVELDDVSERYVSIEIDKLTTIQKTVEINTKNKEDIIGESVISPQLIDISGPSTIINRVSKVIVDVDVDIDNIKSHSILKLPVKVIDKNGRRISGLQTNPDMVEVSLPLLKSKQVTIIPKWVGELEGVNPAEIKINPATVIIRGIEKDIENISSIETEAININDISESGTVAANLVLPKGIIIDSGKSKITLKIEMNKIITKTFNVSLNQINIINLRDDLSSSLYDTPDTNEVLLSLKGNSDELEAINPKDIVMELDLNDLDEGIHDVKLKIIPIKDIEVKDIDLETIKVKIQKK